MKFWREPFDQAAKTPKSSRLLINKDRCKGCGYCVEFCPKEVLKVGNQLSSKGYALVEVANENNCLGCGLCEALCPEFAIQVLSPDAKAAGE